MRRQKKNATSRCHEASGSSNNNRFIGESLFGYSVKQKLIGNLFTLKAQYALPISVTTRGVGFLTDEIYQKYIPNWITFNPLQLYRLSLAQFEYRCSANIERMFKPCSISAFKFFRDTKIDYGIGHYKALGPIASLVNSIGIFEAFGQTYYPMLPILDIGHPLGVTFSNLRETVEALSDPEKSSQEVRKRFYDHNSIPHTVWSKKPDQTDMEEQNLENDWPLLMNADEIMPNGNVANLLSKDYREVANSMARLSHKCKKHNLKMLNFQTLDYYKPGNRSVLSSCYMNKAHFTGFKSGADRTNKQFDGIVKDLSDRDIWSNRPINDNEMILGALNWTGEIDVSDNKYPLQPWAHLRFNSSCMYL